MTTRVTAADRARTRVLAMEAREAIARLRVQGADIPHDVRQALDALHDALICWVGKNG